jgi:hypothetical protein
MSTLEKRVPGEHRHRPRCIEEETIYNPFTKEHGDHTKTHDGYPLVNVYITMERSTISNGKIHYKLPFSIANC